MRSNPHFIYRLPLVPAASLFPSHSFLVVPVISPPICQCSDVINNIIRKLCNKTVEAAHISHKQRVIALTLGCLLFFLGPSVFPILGTTLANP